MNTKSHDKMVIFSEFKSFLFKLEILVIPLLSFLSDPPKQTLI